MCHERGENPIFKKLVDREDFSSIEENWEENKRIVKKERRVKILQRLKVKRRPVHGMENFDDVEIKVLVV